VKVTINVNGVDRAADVEPRTLLVEFLRENLSLTGTHIGCETSQCGACTVLLGDSAVKSCTILAAQADGQAVTTIEGFAPKGMLHPIQQAFWEEHGVQCGYCTPGMVLATQSLLNANANPDVDAIKHGLEGNICRCTGYQNIIRAVQRSAELLASGAKPEPIEAH
jgi:carbon-monoxide dehydrogenase small subunit